jgi:hypothetical protein
MTCLEKEVAGLIDGELTVRNIPVGMGRPSSLPLRFHSFLFPENTIMKHICPCLFLTVLCFAQPLRGQWSGDPNTNLTVCDTSGNQELPKIAATSDGGCYISWFDTRSGAYRVYMQRLNAQGVKQWGENGLLVSANPQSSSLVDWDLAVDDSNNAVVVFTDTRASSTINPYAYRISPQGDFRWGPNGVALSNATSVFQADPKVAVTSDNGFVFVWQYGSSPNQAAMQRLNAAGEKQWGTDPILISGGASEHRWRPSLVASDNGSVILLYAGFTGTTLNPQNYKLFSQKVSSAGTTIWADTVYSQGRVSGFVVPKIFPDANNGAFYVWHDERGGANSTSYVQHFTSSGTRVFPVDGTASSTLAGRLHNDASVAYTPATGETYMFWYETNSSTQNVYGVYGQKFSANGTRQWSDSGKVFRPFGGGQPSFIRCFGRDSSVVVFYLDATTTLTRFVKGFRSDRNGNILWGGGIITVCSVASDKGRLAGAFTANGNSLLAWSDKRLDDNGVYAQELNFEGQLGIITRIGQMDGAVPEGCSLEQNYPNPFNPSTTITFATPAGSQYAVSLRVYDLLGREVATLVNEQLAPGTYTAQWVATGFASGVYFYRLSVVPAEQRDLVPANGRDRQAGEFTQTRRLLLLR